MIPWIEVGPERTAIYERLLPDIRDAAWRLGYSIGVHGTMRRDLDLIAVPWISDAAPAEQLVLALIEVVGAYPDYAHVRPSVKPHGRLAWSLHLRLCPHLYLDLSVLPRHGNARS
jgi:hypothetical protein